MKNNFKKKILKKRKYSKIWGLPFFYKIFGVKNEKKNSTQKKLGIRNCVGRSTGSMDNILSDNFPQKIKPNPSSSRRSPPPSFSNLTRTLTLIF